MPPYRRARLATLLLLALGAGGLSYAERPATDPAAIEMREAFAALPETNPYRDLLLRYAGLPAADRKALGDWPNSRDSLPPGQPAPELTAEQRALVAEFSAGLRAAAGAPPLSAADWPLRPNPNDPDNPAAIIMPGVAPLRALARLATHHADELPPAEAVDLYAAVAQFARQQRAGATLIEQLTGVASEGIAHAGAARRLGEFSAEDLQRLSAAWAALHPAPDNVHAVSGERELFFRPIVENILLPGLREMLASGATADDPFPAPGADAENSLSRDFRLSGLLDLGSDERRIILEDTKSGEHLSLRLGRAVEGVELLSLDFEQRVAHIRRGAEEATVHLATKRIVARQSAIEKLRRSFGVFDSEENAPGRAALAAALARARAHPDGAEGYARELLAAYEAGIARQVALADSARYPEHLEPTEAEKSDPLLALMMPTIGRVCRTFNGSATATTMLQAAIHHRLGQLGAGADPAAARDPWADGEKTPFRTERLPDGGFILRSAYETEPGAPYTYKFAAPDAGFIRQQ